MRATQPLDTLDQRLIALLQKEQTHTALLARKVKQRHSKVLYRLERLEKKGFLTKTRKGLLVMWHIRTRLRARKASLQIFTGSELVQAYQPILTLKRHTVVYSLQGVKAALLGGKIPLRHVEEIHRVFKRKGIVVKSFMHEDLLRVFPLMDSKELESHEGRTLGIRAFSYAESFLGAGDIFVAPTFAYLSNLQANRVVLIKDKHIVGMLYESLSMLYDLLDYSQSVHNVDLNTILRQLLAKRTNHSV